jgi:DNA repair protein RadA/Sms
MADIDHRAVAAQPSGIPELDRVLGSGLVPGSVLLLAGEPGIGKSTLLLQVAHTYAQRTGTALIVTGEESAGQVRLRAGRLGALHERLFLAAETDLTAVLEHVDAVSPSLLVIDSVQTIGDQHTDGVPGGVTQVKAVTAALVELAKRRTITTVLVGHVTKDGHVAGPRTLEHLVDVVLAFEGDEQTALRLVRATKNRYGPVEELGCFRMTRDGMEGVSDPSGLFIARHDRPVPGTCLTTTLHGRRPMLAEVQALATPPHEGPQRRSVSGLDPARVAMMVAVAATHTSVDLKGRDVFVATVGGLRAVEPALDLAIVVALASSVRMAPVRPGLAAFGEVGLAGEVRAVRDLDRRLAEAARLGVTTALVPVDVPKPPTGMTCVRVLDVSQAVAHTCSSAGLASRLGT